VLFVVEGFFFIAEILFFIAEDFFFINTKQNKSNPANPTWSIPPKLP